MGRFKKMPFTFAESARGAGHIRYGVPCQDFALHYRDDSRVIAVVSDGHGGDMHFRSGRGSRFACEVTVECLNRFSDSFKNLFHKDFVPAFGKGLHDLCASIHKSWKERVRDDWRSDPPDFNVLALDGSIYTENISAAYGCTLLAVAAVNNFWFGLHIGDGKCIVLEYDGGFSEPIPWDDACRFNVTTSLCEENAPELFRVFFTPELPEAIFIGTDGIDGSFALEGNGEKIAGLYRIILDNFRNEGFEKGRAALRGFLPELTKRGSGDDVSIAGIIFEKEQ